MERIRGTITPRGVLHGRIASASLRGTVHRAENAAAAYYTGSYAADALFSEQVFPTAQKTMLDDFVVHAINYTEAPNQYGTTVTIGG